MPKPEVHADLSDSAGHNWPTRVNLGRGADPGDQKPPGARPHRLQSLTRREQPNSPTNQNRRGVIKRPANTKIVNRDSTDAHEWSITSRQKHPPTRPQNEARNEVSHSQYAERSQTEHRPRRPRAPRLKLALPDHRLGKIVRSTQSYQRRRYRIRPAPPSSFLFRRQVGQMIAKFPQIAPHMPGRDARPQQAFAKFFDRKIMAAKIIGAKCTAAKYPAENLRESLPHVALLPASSGSPPPAWSKPRSDPTIDAIPPA